MKKLLVIAAVLGIACGVVLLYVAAPTPDSYFPRCLFNMATGLHCPGCGSTRCLHALVHGGLAQAMAYNPVLLLALPFLTLWAIRTGYEFWTGRSVRTWRPPSWCLYVLAGLVVAFWVLRNIPIEPFTHLAPHALVAS
jgi:hypothetical protein